MTVYNINLGIGWASSGVEYAQAYRAKLFRQIKQEARFVFMDLILGDNIQHLTENIGFLDEEVIWLYSHFTDLRIAASSLPLESILSQIEGEPQAINRQERFVRVTYGDGRVLICYLKEATDSIVEQVHHVYDGYLLRKDYYSYTKYCSEFFAPKDGEAQLYQRTFYNEDGSVAYDILMDDKGQEIYRLPGQVCYGKQDFVRYFMKSLNLTPADLVLLDRETGIGQVVFEESQEARLGVVVHAEHYSDNSTTDDYILWNNFYDYQFSHADKVDVIIVATDRQREVLSQQFAHYTTFHPRIVTIPVGSLDQLVYPVHPRRPFSLVTASRLAEEKHIDWLIRAVLMAKQHIPELSLDIYGDGTTHAKLEALIQEGQAQDFIRLMGHHKLTDRYSHYQAYVTASTSEGFGLTLMEAVGAGLPIIGFDVPYGNQTFVRPGQNGYLIPKPESHDQTAIGQGMADKICQLFLEDDLEHMQEASYALAQDFLTSQVALAWQKLLEEVLDDSNL